MRNRFSSTRMPLLAALAAVTLMPMLATARQQPPSSTQWETRALADGSRIAVIAGPGAIQSISLLCRGTAPNAVLVLSDTQAATQFTVASVSFGLIRVNLPLSRDAGQGNVWLSDLSASPLPRLLKSATGKAQLSLDGQPQGALSLLGSTRATREALKNCPSK